MIMLISAGGTGGHIMPALAIALELRNRHSWTVRWLGGLGMEAELSARHKIPFYSLQIYQLRGRGFIRFMVYPFILLRASFQALGLLRRLKPDAVFTTGNYTSVPCALAGFALRVPIFLQEQNTQPGWASRLISLLAVRVYLGLKPPGKLAAKARVFGNPSLTDGAAAALTEPQRRYAARTGPLKVFVTGGSQGAAALNEVAPAALGALASAVEVWHQAGAGKGAATRARYENCGKPEARVEEFIESIAECYQWADLVIARAGALTITDLTLHGVAAILVPYPYAAGNHQLHNARALGDAALVIEQKDFSAAKLSGLLTAWLGRGDAAGLAAARSELAARALAMRSLARPHAAAHITNDLMETLNAA